MSQHKNGLDRFVRLFLTAIGVGFLGVALIAVLVLEPEADSRLFWSLDQLSHGASSHCGLDTRPPIAAASAGPSCGINHTPLRTNSSVSVGTHAGGWVRVRTAHQYDNEVAGALSRGRLVLAEFYATWCPVCQSAEGPLTALVTDPDISGHYTVLRLDVDDPSVSDMASREGITRIPTVRVVRAAPGGTGASMVQLEATIPAGKVPALRQALVSLAAMPERGLEAGRKYSMDPMSGALREEAGPLRLDGRGAALGVERRPEAAAAESTSTGAAAGGFAAATGAEIHRTGFALSSDAMADKAAFLEAVGDAYGYGGGASGAFDLLYRSEVGDRAPPESQHYMDYTGASVYTRSQLEACFGELQSCMLGNPHSENPSSHSCEERVDAARRAVADYFSADPSEYQVVFTSGATGALKMVGEYFPWSQGSTYRYLLQNHNSVLGIREYAKAAGAGFEALDEAGVDTWLRGEDKHERPSLGQVVGVPVEPKYNLFAFPAQENYAGVIYPLDWIELARRRGTASSPWFVLLDAAAYVPTHRLNLTQHRPDFVSLSFYKLFGYPTGLGALIARTEAASILHKSYWGGGSVSLATSATDFKQLKCRPTERLEDGTVSFLDIASLRHGFKFMSDRIGGPDAIAAHVEALRAYLYDGLAALRHSNGAPVVRIFGNHAAGPTRQGGIVNFELLDPSGRVRPYKEFERRAGAAGIHIRTGCSCNPGACNTWLGITDEEVQGLAGQTEGCGDASQFARVARPLDSGSALLRGPDEMGALQPDVVYPWQKGSSAALQQALVGAGGQGRGLSNAAEAAGSGALPPGFGWVNVPLGSIRASLGYMSRWEDCRALIEFVRDSYVHVAAAP